jgi:chromosome segregation protein
MVQLPGKRRQNLTLLSGGERALTSAALLFAMLEARPAPFCILDEVDAPLDENNVDRFIELLKEFSQKSQILIITHSRRTIAAANVIYGVTMETPGISKVFSLKLGKVEEVLGQ